MDFEAVKKYVLDRLKTELSENLTYHSVDHTLDVIEASELISKMEGINGHELVLVKTAALFHDLGFIETYDGHEDLSIVKAREILPQFGYTKNDIDRIAGMINSTRIPQRPSDKLEEIMADADLDYLGRDDLFVIGQRLQYEWKMFGKVSTLREWHEKQLQFLKNHSYFTESSKKLRNKKKQENIKELELLLARKNQNIPFSD
jgi:HD superfamily phosphodiesterase